MHEIPDDWGTACNVQAMVFGNLGDTSATGVAFTRDPSTGEKKLYGEWLPNAQGEDVVAGIRTPLPIRAHGHAGPTTSLEAKMPEAYRELSRIAATLEKHFRDMQDLEFTIQDGKLYMLQCRTGKRAARAAVASRSTWPPRGSSPGKRPCSASTRAASISSSTPRSTRRRPKQAARARPLGEPRRGERSHRLQRRRGRAARRARASPSSSSASRRRPRTSTA